MSLKDEENLAVNVEGVRSSYFRSEDVKEAVNELKKRNFDMFRPFATENEIRNKFDKLIDDIFGDFENEGKDSE